MKKDQRKKREEIGQEHLGVTCGFALPVNLRADEVDVAQSPWG